MAKKRISAAAPIIVPTIYIKDKQAFSKEGGMMRLLGPAVEMIRQLSQKYRLFHIIDLDLKKGSTANFDIYDKLTYFAHIQVECDDEKAIEKLIDVNARAVVRLPTALNLGKWNKKLLVGIVESPGEDISGVNDVIIAGGDEKTAMEIMKKCEKEGKRIMLCAAGRYGGEKKAWAIILDAL